jgi:signal peptidase I
MADSIKSDELILLRRSLRKGAKGSFEISGFSMYPLVRPKDKIRIVHRERYSCGDIIVFKLRDRLVIHRILFSGGNKFFTKGDHNFSGDGWIKRKDVLGVVESVNGVAHNKMFGDYVVLVLSVLSIFVHDIVLFIPRRLFHGLLSVSRRVGSPLLSFLQKISNLFFRKPYYALLHVFDKHRR